jgi:hypothetical protein
LLASLGGVTTASPVPAPHADKLKKTSEASVKWKTLLVMKQVSKSGRMEFRRTLARHTDSVKACLQFRGPPDPLRGDEPYRKVHTAAKEALEAILDTSAPAHSAATSARTMASLSSGPASPGGLSGGDGGGAASFARAAALGGGPGGGGALPGQPGYDPRSQLHRPPISTGTMQGFGNSEGPRVRRVGAGAGWGRPLRSAPCLASATHDSLPPHTGEVHV